MGLYEETNSERIAWVKITGVPISLRLEENYSLIANVVGKPLQVDGRNWSNLDLSYGTACILTNSNLRINNVTTCSFNSKFYEVGIVEYDYNWHPFFHNTATPQPFDDAENDDESDQLESDESSDDDGVSETWEVQGTGELEEGEIDQNNNSEPMTVDDVAFVGDDTAAVAMANADVDTVEAVNSCEDTENMEGNLFSEFRTSSHNDGHKSGLDIPGKNQVLVGSPILESRFPKSIGDGSNHIEHNPDPAHIHHSNPYTPIRTDSTQPAPFVDFEPGDSMGKRRKIDTNFSSLITPRRILVASHSHSSPPPSNFLQPKIIELGSPSLDLNKSFLGSDSFSGNSPNGICLSSNEVDSTIRIGNEVGFQIEMGNDFVEASNI